jgi:hypothetical protein
MVVFHARLVSQSGAESIWERGIWPIVPCHARLVDDLTQQLANLGVQLATSAARNSASAIANAIAAARASRSASEQVVALEQIVSDLLSDKSELTRIAQAYQHELVAQQLTPGDVQYITDAVVPLLEKLVGMNSETGAQLNEQVQAAAVCGDSKYPPDSWVQLPAGHRGTANSTSQGAHRR